MYNRNVNEAMFFLTEVESKQLKMLTLNGHCSPIYDGMKKLAGNHTKHPEQLRQEIAPISLERVLFIGDRFKLDDLNSVVDNTEGTIFTLDAAFIIEAYDESIDETVSKDFTLVCLLRARYARKNV